VSVVQITCQVTPSTMVRWICLALIAALAGCRAVPPAATESVTAAPQAATATPPPDLTYPPDVNPLTGERVADPALLRVPALLVSISHFPATGRPQAGLSFAPFVYEFYITEGATRFLAVFHGEWPEPEIPVFGGCVTRTGPFVQSATILGNRVWLDANGNGLQDPGEGGISGLCVDLYDASGNLIQRASTDSNGYYGFNVQPGRYALAFQVPDGYEFTRAHAGDTASDSDADPDSGRAQVSVAADDRTVDAGLIPAPEAAASPTSSTPPLAEVGPVRSGRLIYSYIADYFRNSCLVYAFASEEVLKRLPQCHMVFHQLAAGGYMMGLDEMQSVAAENLQSKGSDFDYTSNLFADDVPTGGSDATLLKVYFAYQNQSGWAYDPLSQSYLRYVDTSEYDLAGVLHPDTDRLTGRQLHVENLIVLYAKHEVVSPTNLDIHLDAGEDGKAVLFRNGKSFKITWSTALAEQQHKADIRPIQFLSKAGSPVALAPGHTWIIVVTPDSKLKETAAGQWLLSFAQPEGAK
jgi:hypothetical protein